MLPAVGTVIVGFTVLRTVERIPEIDCSLVELEHMPTGFKAVKLIPLQGNYPEFTALIGFQTPPTAHTGLPHILEHSVLCGSSRYPLPAPFEELLQGSLSTYLNAGTYGTFTVYPFASRCKQDYMNIMAVYLDAVFSPLLLKDERIFQQEAWSLRLQNATAELEREGVILNEMRGVFSNPFHIARFALKEALFEGGSLMYESGGHPDHVIKLTPKDLVDFYNQYYTFSNARIAYHSTLPLEEELTLLYERYLQPLEKLNSEDYSARKERKRVVLANPPDPDANKDILVLPYPVSKAEGDAARQGQLVRMWRTYDIKEVPRIERFALSILSSVLFETTSSPVLSHLQKLNYISELSFTYNDADRQAFSFLHLRGCEHTLDAVLSLREELAHVFLLLENENAVRTVHDPLPDYMFYLSPQRISAEIDSLEFRLREHSKNYGVDILSSVFFTWLHDMNPEDYILFEDILAELRAMIEEGSISSYLRTILRKYYIDNTAWKDAILTPTLGLSEETARAEKEELQSKLQMMSRDEIDQLVAKTAAVANRNNELNEKALEDFPRITEENLDSLEDDYLTMRIFSSSVTRHNEPGVHLNDIPINIYNSGSIGNGLVYLNMFIDISDLITFEDAPLISLLARGMLGHIRTESYDTPEQLHLAINNILGNFKISMGYRYTLVRTPNSSETYPRAYIKIDASFLESKTDQALHLIFNEIWRGSMIGFTNLEQVFNLLQVQKEKTNNYFLRKMGYYPAYTRALALSGSIGAIYDEYVNGINYLEYLKSVVTISSSDLKMHPNEEFDFDEECMKNNVYTLSEDDLRIAVTMANKLKDMYAKLLKRHTSIVFCIGLNVPELTPFMHHRIIEDNIQKEIDKILGDVLIVQKLHTLLQESSKTSPYSINKWRMKPDIFPLVEHAAHFLSYPVGLQRRTIYPPEKGSEKFLELKSNIEKRMLSIAAPINANYVARGGRLPLTELNGSELLLLHIITYDYLTRKIRLENGAYGCFFILSRSRWSHIFTYSDPNIVKTEDALNGIISYINNLEFTDEELFRFRIGALGKRQVDLAPGVRFNVAVDHWLENYSVNDYRRAVGQIRRADLQSIKGAATAFEPVLSGQTVVFGKAEDVKSAVATGVLPGYQEY